MPYSRNSELPKRVSGVLPDHAQDIFREAFNSAWDEYKNPKDRRSGGSHEAVANRVAWNAVKQTYEKHEDGKWHSKN